MLAISAIPTVPDAAETLARVQAMLPALRRLAPEADRQRRLPAETMALIRENDVLRTIQPRNCGGFALSMRAHVDVVATLGEGCGATSWVVGVCQAHSWMMGHLPPKARAEVYGNDPRTMVSAVIGPRGKARRQDDGSFVLDGVWPFASGCEHAQWMLLGAEVFGTDGSKIDEADLLVPAAALEIRDDWYVAGLQGTGSATVVARSLPVPAHRALSLPAWLEGTAPSFDVPDEEWLTRAQAIPVLGLCISSGALGIARAALATFIARVPGKPVVYTHHVSDEWLPTQVALGHASAMLHAAELVLYRVADDIDDHARRGIRMPVPMRARIRMDCSHAVRMLKDAIDKIMPFGGASALSLQGSLQRAARDLAAINMHALLLFETSAEIHGRVLLGKDSNSPIY